MAVLLTVDAADRVAVVVRVDVSVDAADADMEEVAVLVAVDVAVIGSQSPHSPGHCARTMAPIYLLLQYRASPWNSPFLPQMRGSGRSQFTVVVVVVVKVTILQMPHSPGHFARIVDPSKPVHVAGSPFAAPSFPQTASSGLLQGGRGLVVAVLVVVVLVVVTVLVVAVLVVAVVVVVMVAVVAVLVVGPHASHILGQITWTSTPPICVPHKLGAKNWQSAPSSHCARTCWVAIPSSASATRMGLAEAAIVLIGAQLVLTVRWVHQVSIYIAPVVYLHHQSARAPHTHQAARAQHRHGIDRTMDAAKQLIC